MRGLPKSEMPRERLVRLGEAALSDRELLAILLVTGRKECPVLDLAAALLSRFGSLAKLLDASLEELQEVPGIGLAKAIQLQAALALGNRAALAPSSRPLARTADELFAILWPLMSGYQQEVMWVALKDVRGRLIGAEMVAMGTLSEVMVHPREVFYPAVRQKAFSIVLAHNHPSGDLTPSTADLRLTRRLELSAQLMGIQLDDHLIVGRSGETGGGRGGYLSLRMFHH